MPQLDRYRGRYDGGWEDMQIVTERGGFLLAYAAAPPGPRNRARPRAGNR